jgi:hypothetical protein
MITDPGEDAKTRGREEFLIKLMLHWEHNEA